jgi:hypothetical protein
MRKCHTGEKCHKIAPSRQTKQVFYFNASNQLILLLGIVFLGRFWGFQQFTRRDSVGRGMDMRSDHRASDFDFEILLDCGHLGDCDWGDCGHIGEEGGGRWGGRGGGGWLVGFGRGVVVVVDGACGQLGGLQSKSLVSCGVSSQGWWGRSYAALHLETFETIDVIAPPSCFSSRAAALLSPTAILR